MPSVCTPKQGAEAAPMPTKTLPSSLAPGSARSSSSTSAGRAASAPSLHRNHRIANARVLPPLRRRPHRQERLCPRPAALFVPWLHMHLQRADGRAAEWAASAGQMAGAHPGAQPRPEHSPGGRAAGGGLEHGVPLASPLPAAAQSAPGQRQASALRGIAEADESYFLESSKGQRALLRQARRRGGKASQRGVSKEQVSVLMVRDRAGATANILVACKRC